MSRRVLDVGCQLRHIADNIDVDVRHLAASGPPSSCSSGVPRQCDSKLSLDCISEAVRRVTDTLVNFSWRSDGSTGHGSTVRLEP